MLVRACVTIAATLAIPACTVADTPASHPIDRGTRHIPDVASLEWQTRMDGDTSRRYAWSGQPAVTPQLVIVAGPTGVVALDRESGKVVWADSAWEQASVRAVSADARHVCVGSAWVGCFDLSSGRRLWGRWTKENGSAGPYALAANTLTVLGDDGYARGYDVMTGTVRWSAFAFSLGGGPVLLGGVVANDSVAFVTGASAPPGSLLRATGITAAFRVRDGSVIWRAVATDFPAASMAPPTLADTILLVSDIWARTVRALNVRTGRVIWTSDRRDPHNAAVTSVRSVAVSGDTVLVGSMDQNIYGLSLATGRTIFKYRTVASVEHVTTCGRWIAFSVLRVGFLDPAIRAVHWSPNDASLDDAFDGDAGIVTSDLARSPDHTSLYYTTNQGVVAVSCTH